MILLVERKELNQKKVQLMPSVQYVQRVFYAFITYDECGLDFSKAVVIESDLYISDQTPMVDTREWNIIKSSQNKIIFEFKKFLRQYKRALKNPDNPRSRSFLRYCSLQYFEIPTPCKQTVAKCNHLNR